MSHHDAERERTTVIDDNIGDYTKPQLFFRLATAYADSSHQIVRSMLAGDLPKTFAHAQTTHFLFDHALELFLKGAILKVTGSIETLTILNGFTPDTESSIQRRHLTSPFALSKRSSQIAIAHTANFLDIQWIPPGTLGRAIMRTRLKRG